MRANDESRDYHRESQEQEEVETYEDEFGYKWVCMAAPSAKRQRTEDNAEGNDDGKSAEHKEYSQKATKAGKGKGKSKGKGKKGPEGGCFDCGGDRFKVNCPKGKGKAGGKPNYYFPKAWWNAQ